MNYGTLPSRFLNAIDSRPNPRAQMFRHADSTWESIASAELLRRVIVKASLEILRETQSLEFSLRELARRAGVSHNAPYKHFADKRELLAAVSAARLGSLR